VVPQAVYTALVHGWIRLKNSENATDVVYRMLEQVFDVEMV